MKKIVFFLGTLVLFFLTNFQTFGQCDPGTVQGTYNFSSPAPTATDCSAFAQSEYAIWSNENYQVTGIVAGDTYVVDLCGSTAWDVSISVYDPAGNLVAFDDGTASGCGAGAQVSFTAPVAGTYSVVVGDPTCTSNQISNGNILLFNNSDMVTCPPAFVCLATADWVDLNGPAISATPVLLCNATSDTIFVGIADLGLATNVTASFGDVLTPALAAATAGIVAYSNTELAAAAGGVDTIILADQANPTCADTLLLDLTGITDVTTFCTNLPCDPAAVFVDLNDNTGAPAPVFLCNATADSVFMGVAATAGDTLYNISSATGDILTGSTIPDLVIAVVGYSQADIAGGMDTILFSGIDDPSCLDTLIVDFTPIGGDIAAFCAGSCDVSPTWVDFDAMGVPAPSATPVPFCSAGGDTISLFIAALGNVEDSMYTLTATAGSLGTNSVDAFAITSLDLTQADIDALDIDTCGTGDGIITIYFDGINNGVCMDSLVVDFSGLSNIMTACTGMGCMDMTACNFDPLATTDDGSCIIPPPNCDCCGIFPEGGAIATTDPTTICAGDGTGDPINVTLTGEAGTNSQWVITDAAGMILDLPAGGPPFDLDGAGPGVCLIWHLSFEDGLMGAAVGNNAADLMGCFSLSNSISVTRLQPEGGMISTTDPTTICAGDGTGDPINVTLTGETGTNSQWVITDAAGMILDLPAGPPFDLDGAGPGVCLIWHLSFEDGLMGAAVGNNAADLMGCFSLSNSITVTRQESGVDCNTGGSTACPPDVPFATENNPPLFSVDCDGNPFIETINGCNYAEEYATINNLVPGETYCFSTENGTGDYVSIYDDLAGTALADGPADGSICVVAPASGTLYMQINLNDGACGTESTCRDSFVSCPSCPVPAPGCTNPVADNFDPNAICDDGTCVVTNTACPPGTAFANESNPPVFSGCGGTPILESINTCNYAGEYATIDNLTPGETYCFSTNEGVNDYVTMYDDVAGAPLADGPADGSVCVVAPASGTLFMQINLNDMACGTESACRESFVSCQTCPPPPTGCTNPCADNYDAAALCDDGSCMGALLPVNDFCSNAVNVTLDTPVSGNTDCSTFDAIASNLPTCGTSLSAQGNWYTVTGNGLDYVASLCGSAYDTKIHVFTGDCSDASTLTCVDGNDDAFGVCSPQSEIGFPTNDGEDYYIYVSGFGTNTGDYTLTITDACILTTGDCLTVERVCDGNALFVKCFNEDYIYTWTNQDTGESVTVAGSPYFSPTEIGTYYVEITDAGGTFTANGTCSTFTVNEIIDCRNCGE